MLNFFSENPLFEGTFLEIRDLRVIPSPPKKYWHPYYITQGWKSHHTSNERCAIKNNGLFPKMVLKKQRVDHWTLPY